MLISTARFVVRSPVVRDAASKLASLPKSARSSPFQRTSRTHALGRGVFRSPVEMSACMESLNPYHTATASSLLTSLLTVSRCGFCWIPEAFHHDVFANQQS